jgi:hypothetical protein
MAKLPTDGSDYDRGYHFGATDNEEARRGFEDFKRDFDNRSKAQPDSAATQSPAQAIPETVQSSKNRSFDERLKVLFGKNAWLKAIGITLALLVGTLLLVPTSWISSAFDFLKTAVLAIIAIWVVIAVAALLWEVIKFIVSAAVLLIVVAVAYVWIQKNYVAGENYKVYIKNESLKVLSFRIVNVIKCASFKADTAQILVSTVNPGETKLVFEGCMASSFNFSINGKSPYPDFKAEPSSCFRLTSDLELAYGESGWTEPSVVKVFGARKDGSLAPPFTGAVKRC